MSKMINTGAARATSITVRRFIGDNEVDSKKYSLSIIKDAPISEIPLMSEEGYLTLIQSLIDIVQAQEPGIVITTEGAIKEDAIACPLNTIIK